MYPFPQNVTPAVRGHLDAQMSFLNDMSKSLFRSFQQLCDLNIQLTQTMLEETAIASQQLMTADRQTDVISAAASRAQPATEKLRAYQQHIARVAADAQVELARVTEQHVETTTRTARTLADEVARTATEETERGMRAQQETIRQFTDPFKPNGGAGEAQMRSGGTAPAGASMQSGGQGSAQGSSTQGAGAQPSHSSAGAASATAGKSGGTGARKE